MVMAWWRGAPYASRMRFFRDSDAETPVQWKLARRGAKDFPLYHLFHLAVLEDRPTGPRWPVGEVPASVRAQKVWHHSTLPGVCFTGTPEQWAGGCLLSDTVPDKPPCCLPPWVLPVPVVIGLDFLWGTVVTLLVEQYDGTGRVPTVTTLDFEQASRLLVESLGPGHAGVRWLGVRGYHAGDGYFGPQPDVEFLDGGGLTWTVTQDAVNKRVVVGATVLGGGVAAPVSGAATFPVDAQLFTGSGYADTPCQVTLPSAGTFLVVCQFTATLRSLTFLTTPFVDVLTRLRDVTDPTHLTGLEGSVTFVPQSGSANMALAGMLTAVVVATAPGEVVRLQGQWTSTGSPGPNIYLSDVVLSYLQAAPAGPPGPPGAPGSMTVGSTPVTGGTPGQILTVGGDGTLSQSSPPGGTGAVAVSLTNRSGGSIPAGMAVTTNAPGTGIIPADGTPAGVAFGITSASSADLAPADVVTSGLVALADWTASSGGVNLVPGTNYFLGPGGSLVVVPPSSPGAVVQYLGRAVGPQTLELQPGDPIIL